ncbi:PAS domain-containing hybrid sensor histidine kinase/response regulator [Cognatishimia sp. F0-27]|uniref:PAS domain-containing hybrid sensor histidine kinase/response regulator n=1 Tax=Cognatishimia sp. F0-27 TaxID=2816855 RepID=UPI001D0CC634|nr:PAS domain-containing hybrid sensor histidine kinase/response regulator [Cognatishimia sp. F0-27]MCC1495130.1 response regulator [Cognatishimia sp. F0-27]
MTVEVFEDAARILMLACVLLLLWSFGRERFANEQPGWNYLVAGLGLIVFGGFWDLSRNFPDADRMLKYGSFDVRIILENIFGYLGGLLLVGVGLYQFLPRVDLVFNDNLRRKKDEEGLRLSINRLGNEVAEQTTKLGMAREDLEAIEARLRAFFRHVPAFIDVSDKSGQAMNVIPPSIGAGESKQPRSLQSEFYSIEPDLAEVDRKVLKSGQPVSLEVTGKSEKAECVLHVLRFPIVDRNESTLGVGGIAFDVTADRSLEKKLLRAESIARIGHWEVSFPENKLTWSPETFRIHGLPPGSDQPSVEEALAFYHPGDVDRVSEHFARVFETGQLQGVSARLVLRDGQIRHVYADGVALMQDASGHPSRIFGILHDRTELVEQQKQLKKAQRFEAIGQMAGGIAHDFNNLLAVICGNLELLDEGMTTGAFSEAERRDCIGSALAAARSGADLTKNMLAFASKSQLAPQRVCIHDLVEETERWLVRTIPSSIALTLSLDAENCFCRLDHAGLQSALVNVVVNARDAMPDGGELFIETRNLEIEKGDEISKSSEASPQGSYLELAVRDSGHGMPPELLQRAFEPFVTTKELSTGTGLGLSMVQGFTRQSGGEVEITSELGVGTCVRLLLPLDVTEDTAADQPDDDRDSALGKNRGIRVLVVEDQPEVLALLIRSLTSAGFRVEAASSGVQGLEVFRKEGPFDLLITDIVMPGELNGTNLAAACRETIERLPVLFLTGYSDKRLEPRTDVSRNELCLTKPVPRAELLAAIEKLTNQQMA